METKSIKLEQGIQTAADSLKESLDILKNSQKKQMYILNFYKDIQNIVSSKDSKYLEFHQLLKNY